MVAGRYLPGTFQPTFLYECIWDLATFGLLLLIEKRVRLRRGYLFAAYAALYTFGRFFTEYLRIDPAHRYLGLRLNDWTSVLVFAAAAAVLVLEGRPGAGDELVGGPLPAKVLAAQAEVLAARPGADQPDRAGSEDRSPEGTDVGHHPLRAAAPGPHGAPRLLEPQPAQLTDAVGTSPRLDGPPGTAPGPTG